MGRLSRRQLLAAAGAGVLALPRRILAQAAVVKVGLAFPRGQYFFDPAGVWIPRGGTVRWEFAFSGGVGALMGVSVTAFHPANENHELRIPAAAKPFDSGPMNRAANGFIRFEHVFDEEGTYDYFSLTHESIGMVGRVVVGRPGGPAEQAPGYGAREGRAPMFPASAAILNACPSQQIVEKKTIPYPRDVVVRPYPYGESR
jgi:plastocyanin